MTRIDRRVATALWCAFVCACSATPPPRPQEIAIRVGGDGGILPEAGEDAGPIPPAAPARSRSRSCEIRDLVLGFVGTGNAVACDSGGARGYEQTRRCMLDASQNKKDFFSIWPTDVDGKAVTSAVAGRRKDDAYEVRWFSYDASHATIERCAGLLDERSACAILLSHVAVPPTLLEICSESPAESRKRLELRCLQGEVVDLCPP